MSGKLQTVHVRVNDAATGQPTPVRIRFTDAHGCYWPPHGRLSESLIDHVEFEGNALLDGKAYAYIDGTCEIDLPPGLLRVEVRKGPEYLPLLQDFSLSPGKRALRLAIQRWTDLRRQGWYSGDAGPHNLSPHGALLEAAGEDLAVVNLLAWEDAEEDVPGGWLRRPNLLAFSGQRPALELPGHLLVVNTFNRHPALGGLALLNCHRIVYPLHTGTRLALGDWTLADWCGQCHRKQGLVAWTEMAWSEGRRGCGEALADLLLGHIDAVHPDFHRPDWYALLNLGFRVPLLCSSVRSSAHDCLGAWRTYARLAPGEEFTYKGWIEAVRAGRTFVSAGPLLFLIVNGKEPGETVALSEPAVVQVRAEASSLTRFERLEVVASGKVVASSGASGTPYSAVIEAEVSLSESGWLSARCWGPYANVREQGQAAQTSPVYVQVEGRRSPADAGAVAALLESLRTMLHWIEREARFENEQQRQRLAGIFLSAQGILLAKAKGGSPGATPSSPDGA